MRPPKTPRCVSGTAYRRRRPRGKPQLRGVSAELLATSKHAYRETVSGLLTVNGVCAIVGLIFCKISLVQHWRRSKGNGMSKNLPTGLAGGVLQMLRRGYAVASRRRRSNHVDIYGVTSKRVFTFYTRRWSAATGRFLLNRRKRNNVKNRRRGSYILEDKGRAHVVLHTGCVGWT